MAELAALIAQIKQSGTDTLSRIDGFRALVEKKPSILASVSTQLSDLILVLDISKDQADALAKSELIQDALLSTIQNCLQRIDAVLTHRQALYEDGKDLDLVNDLELWQRMFDCIDRLRECTRMLTHCEATDEADPGKVHDGNGIAGQEIQNSVTEALFLVPFARNENFTGREDVIARVDASLRQESRFALTGISGTGKSQIAIEYCYRYKENHPESNVFWVSSGSSARFEQIYKGISPWLSSSGYSTDLASLGGVDGSSSADTPFLMVLDGADDADIFFKKTRKNQAPLADYLPRFSNGKILMTTLNKGLGDRLCGLNNSLEVPAFSTTEAEQLLRSGITEAIWDDEIATQLLNALKLVPVAISLAVAFISQQGVSLSHYLHLYEADDPELPELLVDPNCDSRQGLQTSTQVMKTWKISFDYIREQDSLAVKILVLMAVLDHQGIPGVVFRSLAMTLDYIGAVEILHTFSFIAECSNIEWLEINSSVCFSIRHFLQSEGSLDYWRDEALRCLDSCFPPGDIDNWQLCRILYPHAVTLETHEWQNPEQHLLYGDLLRRVAAFEFLEGHYERSLIHCRCIGQIHRRFPYQDLTHRIARIENEETIGGLLIKLGHCDEAVDILRKTIADAERLPRGGDMISLRAKMTVALAFKSDSLKSEGLLREVLQACEEDSNLWLSCLSNLGSCLIEQGKLQDGAAMVYDAWKRQHRILGPYHPSTILSLESYEATLGHGKREVSLADVYMMQARVLGAEHPSTLLTLMNWASRLASIRKLPEALTLASRALASSRRVSGPLGRQTLKANALLGRIFSELENYDLAKAHFQRALKGFAATLPADDEETFPAWWNYLLLPDEYRGLENEREFPPEHPVALQKMIVEADKLCEEGRFEEALEKAAFALKGHIKMKGWSASDVKGCVRLNVICLRNLSKYSEAEQLLRKAIPEMLKNLRPEDWSILIFKNSLAEILADMHRYDEGEPIHKEVLETIERMFTDDSAAFHITLASMAYAYSEVGDYVKAEGLYRRIIARCERCYNPESERTLEKMLLLSKALVGQEKYEEAIIWGKRAWEGLLRDPKHDGKLALQAQRNVADIAWNVGDVQQALSLTQAVAERTTTLLGPENRESLNARGRYARLLSSAGRHEEAIAEQCAVYEICRKQNLSNAFTQGHCNLLADYYEAVERYVEAITITEEVAEACEDEYGEEAESTQDMRFNLQRLKELEYERKSRKRQRTDSKAA